MEGESAGEGGASNNDQFNFAFDDDGADHLVTNHNMQMPPKQKNKATEHIEIGSSSESPPMNRAKSRENLTGSEFTPLSGGLISDPLHEQTPNLGAMETSFSTPLVETSLNNHQILAQPFEKSGPSVSSSPILRSPETAFNPLLIGALQPYPPPMENLDLGSSAGNNWFSLNQANSTQNFMPGGFTFPSSQSSNPPLTHAQNESETTPFFFNSLMSSTPQPHRPRPMHMGVSVRDGAVEPFHPNQNAVNQPPPQIEQLPLSLTLGHSQYGTNRMMAGLGVRNQRPSLINPEQATLYSQQLNAPSRLWTPPGFWTQNNQVMPANGVFDLQWTNFIPYGAVQIRPQGPQQLMNHPQQLNQVQPPNTFGSRSQYHRQAAGLSTPLGPNFSNRHQEVNAVLTHPPWILESSMAARAQGVGGQQQRPEHMQMIPNIVDDSQLSIPIQPRPSVLSNIADPQHHSSGLSKYLMPLRFAPVQLDEILNQPTIPSGSSSQRSGELQNSPTEQGIPEQHGYAAKLRGKRPHLGKSSSPAKCSEGNSAAGSRAEVNIPLSFESQEKELDMFSNISLPFNPREVRNSLYDPAFEAMGLPIDPHLRMFQFQAENKQFPPNNR